MSVERFLFGNGATGRGVMIDASGRLICNAGAGDRLPFSYGDTGRACVVDPSGRLMVNLDGTGGGGGGGTYTGANLGVGARVFKQVSGTEFQYRTIMAGSGVILEEHENVLTLIASGAANNPSTASNLGGDVGIYSTKVDDDFRFKGLTAGSGIELIDGTNEITINNRQTRAIDISITDVGNYYAVDNVESALQSAGLKNKNFIDASGAFQTGVNTANQVRTDFDNASGVFSAGIAVAAGVRTDFDNASGIFVKSISSASGATLISSATGPTPVLKGIIANSGLLIKENSNTIDLGVGITISNVGQGEGAVVGRQSDDFRIKSFLASSGIYITSDTDDVIIADSIFAKNLGAGSRVYEGKIGDRINFRTIVAGSGIGVTENASDLTLSNPLYGKNLGAGSQIFAGKDGDQFKYRTLTAGSGINLLQGANSVEVKTPMLIAKPFKNLAWASGMSVDLAQYNNYYLQMGANNTVIQSLTNPVDGAKYTFWIRQNDAGSKTITFPTSVKWANKTPIELTAASGSIDVAVLIYNSIVSQFIGGASLNCG